MDPYEKAFALAAELAEALNGHSIAFAYHSGKIENEQITCNDTREIFEPDGVTSYTSFLKGQTVKTWAKQVERAEKKGDI